MVLRAGTLLSKFAVMYFLARLLPVEAFTLFGLFSVAITYFLYLVGLDFYTYATRDLAEHRDRAQTIIRSQILFYLFAYAAAVPVALLFFRSNLLPSSLMLLFFLILLVEHLSQEGFRLFVAIGLLLQANWFQFLRMGVWPIAILAGFSSGVLGRTLQTVLWTWFAFALISVLWTAAALNHMGMLRLKGPVDWRWIRLGLRYALPMFLATLCLRGVMTFDRYIMKVFFQASQVGSYILFWNIANGFLAFIDTGIVSNTYPKMLTAPSDAHRKALAGTMRRQLLWVYGLAALPICLASYGITLTLSKTAFRPNFYLMPVILAASFCYSISLPDHFYLYACKQDRKILLASVAGFLVFVAANGLAAGLGLMRHPLVVLGSVLLAFLVIFGCKLAMARRPGMAHET